jgi:hypothetical protein
VNEWLIIIAFIWAVAMTGYCQLLALASRRHKARHDELLRSLWCPVHAMHHGSCIERLRPWLPGTALGTVAERLAQVRKP